MPKDSKDKGSGRRSGGGAAEIPSTIARSDDKAKRTWKEAHDSAVESYGEGERAHRTAFAALKHTHEKVGDHWEPKSEKGPSDPRAAKPTREAREGKGETFGGIDFYGHTKKEFEQRAKSLGITGYSHMRKEELVKKIAQRERSQEAKDRKGKKAA